MRFDQGMRNPDLALWKALLCLPQRTTSGGLKKKILARTNRPEIAHARLFGTEKLIEYKTYLQALPYFDRSEGDRGVTE